MSKWKEQKAQEAQQAEQKGPQAIEEFEEGALNGLEKLHEEFRERAAREAKRTVDVVNCDYYFVVCFSNRGQLFEFCEGLKLNPNEIYIDGREFARKINRALQTPDTQFPKTQAFNRDYVSRAREKTT